MSDLHRKHVAYKWDLAMLKKVEILDLFSDTIKI